VVLKDQVCKWSTKRYQVLPAEYDEWLEVETSLQNEEYVLVLGKPEHLSTALKSIKVGVILYAIGCLGCIGLVASFGIRHDWAVYSDFYLFLWLTNTLTAFVVLGLLVAWIIETMKSPDVSDSRSLFVLTNTRLLEISPALRRELYHRDRIEKIQISGNIATLKIKKAAPVRMCIIRDDRKTECT
jgi:hypothetical protein